MTAPKVSVVATDPATGESDTQEIWDDYCLVTAGGCDVSDIQVWTKADGSETHMVTIKGVRR